MNLFNAMYHRLHSNNTLATLVGTSIWEGIARDGAFPCLVLEIDRLTDPAIDARECGHFDANVHVVAITSASRDAITDAVLGAINRQTWTESGATIFSCLAQDENRDSSPELGNAERIYFTSDIVFSIISGHS